MCAILFDLESYAQKKHRKSRKRFFVFSLVLEGLDSYLSQVFQKLEIFEQMAVLQDSGLC